MNSLTFRVSVSNDPELEVDWEVVLEESFEIEGVDVSTEMINFQLDSLVNEKRYIKFEILSFGGNGGCIQYFDVYRKPKTEKTGIVISIQNVSIFTILSSIRNFLYQEFNWRGYKGPGSFNI